MIEPTGTNEMKRIDINFQCYRLNHVIFVKLTQLTRTVRISHRRFATFPIIALYKYSYLLISFLLMTICGSFVE